MHQDDMKEKDEFILFFKIVQCKTARGKELNILFPPNTSDDLCLFFCLYPSSMAAVIVKLSRNKQSWESKRKNKIPRIEEVERKSVQVD